MTNLAKSRRRMGGLMIALCLMISAFSCGKKTSAPVNNDYPTMEITSDSIMLFDRYSASVKGKQNVEIRPQVSGLITEICINEGAEIKKGQPLFIIDQVPYQTAWETAVANVKSAEAKVATARLTVESKEELYKERVISEFDLQTAKNALLETQALLTQATAAEINARNNLSYTIVKSPVDGVSSMIPYKVGTLVSPSISSPLTTVSSDNEMYVYFSMTESKILDFMTQYGSLQNMINAFPKVNLVLNNGTSYPLEGKIDAVSGTVDAKTGSVSVRASFPNPGKLLRNGGTATVVIPYAKNDCVIIPQSATYEIQNHTYVYKVVEGKTQSAQVETFAIHNGKSFVIESGLQKGDIIISEGAGLLREGIPVNTQNHQ